MAVTSVLNIASLRATAGIANGDTALVAGYYTAGDQGGGAFIWNSTAVDADDNGMTIAVPGVTGRWKRPQSENIVVKWFGAKGDGTNDDQPAIQAAIDYAIYFAPGAGTNPSGRRTVYIPEGTYLVGNTVHVGYGISFSSVTVSGAGPRFDQAPAQFSGTTITCTFTDRPCINIQGGVQTRLKNLTIRGKYDYIMLQDLGAANNANDLDVGTWQDPAYPNSAYSDYAPYVGISIDAYSGSKPVMPIPAYPDVNYPALLGPVTQYGKSASIDVVIEDCDVVRFCVGIARLSNRSSNGERIQVKGGLCQGCIYGFAVCHPEARNNEISNYSMTRCFTAITGLALGLKQGNLHGTYLNINFGQVINLIEGTGAYSGPVALRDCHAEAFARIGQMSATGNSTTFTLDNCYFTFREFDSGALAIHGVPANHMTGADTKVLVRNSYFALYQFLIMQVSGTATSIVLDGAQIVAANATTVALTNAFNGTAGLVALTARVNAEAIYYRPLAGSYNYADSEQTSSTTVPYVCNRTTARTSGTTQTGNAFSLTTPKMNYYNYQGQAVTLTSRSGYTVRMSRSAYFPGSSYILLDLGDVLRIEDALFVVTAIPAAGVAELRQVSNFLTTPLWVNKSSSDTPNAKINGHYLNRVYTPTCALAASSTSGSSTLSSVKTAQDGNQFTGVAGVGVAVGDLWIGTDNEFVNVGGNSTNRLAKITAENVAGRTITLSAAVPFTKQPVMLNYFLKVYNP